jgi:transposase
LVGAAQPLAQAVRTSRVVGSDETSARVGGKTCWQWVLLSSTAIYHVITDTRTAGVVTDFLSGAQPEVWVADRYAGQLGHGAVRQMCLAHPLRDANYAIEEGCNGFALEFKWLPLRAISIGRPGLKDGTPRQYHADLERRLDRLLNRQHPNTPASGRLFKAMRRHRDDLFRFVLDPTLESFFLDRDFCTADYMEKVRSTPCTASVGPAPTSSATNDFKNWSLMCLMFSAVRPTVSLRQRSAR